MKPHFVFMSAEGYSLALASHLIDEGYPVTFAMIDNFKQLGLPDYEEDAEEAKDRKERISNYDDIIEKKSLKSVMAQLARVKAADQKNYFFFFDHGDYCMLSEKVLSMGFRNGLFPTQFYRRMEKDRVWAKKFVEENYPGLKVAGYANYETVEDGIAAINESEEVLVLKSNGSFGKTVVPHTDDVETEKAILIDTLKRGRDQYEQHGFTLEEKISDCLEVTPIMIFWNGKPIHSTVEFENKQYGAGNIGAQKGGNQALSMLTDMDCDLNRISFPPIVFDLAAKHPGLAVFDVGLLYNGKDFYFSEFAGMRYGWDGIFSEMVMSDNGKPFVGRYFEEIMRGRSPLVNQYGVSLRLFNYEGNQEDTDDPLPDVPMTWEPEIDDFLFVYHAHRKGKEIVTTSDSDFIGVMTAAGDEIDEVVAALYKRVDQFHFEKLYYRPEFDFLSTDYKSSILNRLEAIEPFLNRQSRNGSGHQPILLGHRSEPESEESSSLQEPEEMPEM